MHHGLPEMLFRVGFATLFACDSFCGRCGMEWKHETENWTYARFEKVQLMVIFRVSMQIWMLECNAWLLTQSHRLSFVHTDSTKAITNRFASWPKNLDDFLTLQRACEWLNLFDDKVLFERLWRLYTCDPVVCWEFFTRDLRPLNLWLFRSLGYLIVFFFYIIEFWNHIFFVKYQIENQMWHVNISWNARRSLSWHISLVFFDSFGIFWVLLNLIYYSWCSSADDSEGGAIVYTILRYEYGIVEKEKSWRGKFQHFKCWYANVIPKHSNSPSSEVAHVHSIAFSITLNIVQKIIRLLPLLPRSIISFTHTRRSHDRHVSSALAS